MKQRLNKIIAKSGICSRRKADELIQQGEVKLNGNTVTSLGVQADPQKDIIIVNNKPLQEEEKVYILLNKPTGYTTTTKDVHAEKTVFDLLPKLSVRLYPVGRLDKDTSGLLILTNDGNLSYKLTHPKFGISRVYEVSVKYSLPKTVIRKIEAGGLCIDDYTTYPCTAELILRKKNKTKLKLTIKEGKKRQIRKMFELVGHPVIELKRVQFGKLKLGYLKEGKYRRITKKELL